VRPWSVLVVHAEMLTAEAISSALAAFPGFVPLRPATSGSEAEARAERAGALDAAAVDERLCVGTDLAARLRRRGARVVLMGRGPAEPNHDEGIRVSTEAPVAALAAALVPSSGQPRRAAPLSAQQTRVLSLVARGLTAKEVARQLGISPKTVEQHKSRIFERLGVPNQAAAVRAVFDPVGRTTSWRGV
jgi:DNA-binding CsgD family transcriptional regulator